VAKLSTYLTGAGGAQAGNLTDPVAMQRKDLGLYKYFDRMFFFCILEYNQGPTGQYCVQIAIERTVIIFNINL
jgi:hypothetical protein